MTLSIITINYNNLEGLRKTIDSVISQTWHDFEWIIIDGGSTDGSKELIEDTANKLAASDFNPLSYWCSEPDNGIYNAMNKGIEHCIGEYVNFMNSGDCFYEGSTLERVFSKKHTGDIVYGDTYMDKGDDSFIKKATNPITIYMLFLKVYFCHQSSFIKTMLLKDRGYDESYKISADYARWIEFALSHASFQYIPETICKSNRTGISSTMLKETDEEIQHAVDTLIPTPVLLTLKEHFEDHKILYNPFIMNMVKIMKAGGTTFTLFKLLQDIINSKDRIKASLRKII